MKKKQMSFMMMFCLLFCLLMAGNASAAKQKDIKYYGHRGYTERYPENTRRSLKKAVTSGGFDGVEFDVFETKSGDLMVFHDSTLSRMCGVEGTIFDVSEENREDYPIVTGPNVETMPDESLLIPTFREVVKDMAKLNVGMFINLKGCAQYTDDGIEKMSAILEKYNMAEKSVIFCSDIPLLKKFRKRGMHIGYLDTSEKYENAKEKLKKAIKNHIEYYIMFRPSLMTKSIVSKCRKNDMIVGVYKVQTMKEANRLRELKVDFMFNYDHLLKK